MLRKSMFAAQIGSKIVVGNVSSILQHRKEFRPVTARIEQGCQLGLLFLCKHVQRLNEFPTITCSHTTRGGLQCGGGWITGPIVAFEACVRMQHGAASVGNVEN